MDIYESKSSRRYRECGKYGLQRKNVSVMSCVSYLRLPNDSQSNKTPSA